MRRPGRGRRIPPADLGRMLLASAQGNDMTATTEDMSSCEILRNTLIGWGAAEEDDYTIDILGVSPRGLSRCL